MHITLHLYAHQLNINLNVNYISVSNTTPVKILWKGIPMYNRNLIIHDLVNYTLHVSFVYAWTRWTEFGGQAGQADRIWGAGGPNFRKIPGFWPHLTPRRTEISAWDLRSKKPPNRRIYTSTRGVTGGKIGDFRGSNSSKFLEFCQIFRKFPENFRNFGQIWPKMDENYPPESRAYVDKVTK